LHNLPLHTVPLGGQPWCERRAIGYLSCAGALSFPRVAASGAPVFIAGNSRRDLPGAEAECQAIANLYNVRALTGADCTRAALEAALASGPLDIVHLAVHGRGNPLRGGQASLLLADETGDVAWTDLDALTCKPWRVNLVVLSGCSTGLGGLRYGHQLISVAGRILEAGADAVVASLWPVGDDAAHRAMIAFHTALLQARRSGADLRCALDVARATLRDPAAANIHKLRDGRDFAPLEGTDPGSFDPALAAALDWASFFVVGVPRF
jgi:CHAT domain-containing protein